MYNRNKSKQKNSKETRTNNTTPDERECPECESQIKTSESGETVCSDCGLIIDETMIDRGPEWRSFDANTEEEKSRVGSPVTNLQHDKGLSTKIGWEKTDANGNTISQNKKRQISRLRKWNKRNANSTKDRNLKQALTELQRMGSALGISKATMETASMIFRQAHKRDMVKGRSIETMTVASLYAACRQCGNPRSLDEFYPVTRNNKKYDENKKEKEINRAALYLIKELNLEIKPPDPKKFVNRFVNQLECDTNINKQKIKRKTKDIIDVSAKENNHSGKSPTSLTAAAIYAACLIELGDRSVTQKDIAEVCDVTTVTIRNTYNDMLEAYTTEAEL